jgi:hypothetical protein
MQLSRHVLSGRDEKTLIYVSPRSVLQESTKKLVDPYKHVKLEKCR